MGENTKIEWCDATWNPWIGCQRVSPGCQHCYAETLMDQRYGKVKWGPTGTRQRTSEANWRKPLQWNKQAAKDGIQRKVFCASLADVFEDRRGQDALAYWRAQLWHLIEHTPNLDWLLLTKRPENVLAMTPKSWIDNWPVNIWIGTSVEDQQRANERIPHLLNIPARVRFLSCEPLLGPVDLGRAIPCGYYCDPGPDGGGHYDHPFWAHGIASPIHWVIVGGESGHGARPMHPDWARSLRDQCQAAGVAFHFKQHGEWVSPVDYDQLIRDTRDYKWYSFHDGDKAYTNVIRAGKHAAGRLLDGREWNEFPEAASS